jgi:hypothetical protein
MAAIDRYAVDASGDVGRIRFPPPHRDYDEITTRLLALYHLQQPIPTTRLDY